MAQARPWVYFFQFQLESAPARVGFYGEKASLNIAGEEAGHFPLTPPAQCKGSGRGRYCASCSPRRADSRKDRHLQRGPRSSGWFRAFNSVERRPVVVVLLRGGRQATGPRAAAIAGDIYRQLDEENYFAGDISGSGVNRPRTGMMTECNRSFQSKQLRSDLACVRAVLRR